MLIQQTFASRVHFVPLHLRPQDLSGQELAGQEQAGHAERAGQERAGLVGRLVGRLVGQDGLPDYVILLLTGQHPVPLPALF